ncbi:MAG: AraC family transcriptional regulator [Filimonas sp.]|nr:AraC family transcriptional regulator [Filimonas sp.]
MQVSYYQPNALLLPFLHCYAFMYGEAPVENWRQPIIPSMLPYMGINFTQLSIAMPNEADADTPAIFMMGLTSSTFIIGTQKEIDVISVHFTADGLFRLTGIPAHYFFDKIINYEDINATVNRLLSEQLSAASNHQERYQLLDSFFMSLFYTNGQKKNTAVDMVKKAMDLVLYHGGTMPVDVLAKTMYCSKRNLERRFREVLGVTPKTFSRLIHFNASVKQLADHRNKASLEENAWELGYHDLSHFTRDFKAFYLKSPGEFCKSRDEMESSCLTLLNILIPTPVIPNEYKVKRMKYYVG